MKPVVKTSEPTGLARFTSRAVEGLLGAWRDVRDSARTAMGGKTVRPDLPEADMAFLRQQMNA